MKNNFYIFCSFDEWYIDLSYVFFASFNKFNSDKILHVHCINFSNEKFAQYKENVTKLFSNIVVESFVQESNSKLLSYDDRESPAYAAHTEVLEHKIKFWATSNEKHILYLDIDLLIRGDLSVFCSDTTTNVIGSRMHQNKGYGYNAGVIVINQPDNRTMWEQYQTLLKNSKDKVCYPEEYLLDNIKNYTRGEFDAHWHCVPQSDLFDESNTVITHFFPIYLKLWSTEIDKIVCTIFGTKFMISANAWYELYDKMKALNILSDRFCQKVDKKRSAINKFLQLKSRVDQRRNKLYGSILQ